ncbi:30S ribosome-binding factor RbfA [Kineococcus sp. SYSU DK001]|uniref:30S ribosome-binding factor RbfA n=1 Tax=Kineococcus sp. SYSU DK001 TaxID=3383122 RepID=UPI003D7E1B80
MADPTRARKLADRIKVVVADALDKRVKDPRLGFVTITDARVTNDLQHATLYYTVLGSEEEKAGTRAALESAKGVLRSEVGKRTGIRLTPTLTFTADEVPETAQQITELLSKAAEQDARVAALAQGAKPAGDVDPYRKPVEHADDDDLDEDSDEDLDDDLDEDDEVPGEPDRI